MRTLAYINGQPTESENYYQNIDPATGESLGEVCRGGATEIDAAVQAATEAHPAWYKHSPKQRADLILAFADAILEAADDLAVLESEDTGKPLSQARADAVVCARYFQYYGRVIEGYLGTQIPFDPGFHAFTERVPFGVTGHIVAWNYPMQLMARGVAPALVTGNCVVVKPADETPRSAVALAELATKVGLPAGVFNVVPGHGTEAGALLTAHPGVRQIGFVGSTVTARHVGRAAAERTIPASLELGGKSAHIVFEDADLERAAEAIAKGLLQNAGQTCSAGSRLIVHSAVQEPLLEMLKERFTAAKLGPGSSDPDVGPLVSRKQQERVQGFLEGLEPGQIVCGGHAPGGDLAGGSYFLPTIVRDVDPASELGQEEVFGPVLAVFAFDETEQAVALANGTNYALMGAVWTNRLDRALTVSQQVEAGQVYVNAFGAGGGVELPFGGFKDSGFGREKGLEALDAYTQSKTYIVKL